jgi:hypothetical protein
MRLFQFLLGLFLGLILFAGGVAGIGYFFLKDVLQNPDKPIFAEEKPKPKSPSTNQKVTPKKQGEQTTPQPSPSPTPTAKNEEELPKGAYKAKVTWSEGLSLRSEPSTDSERVGGVDFNQELVILQSSSDGKWQKVRTVTDSQEGWIKAGNVERLTETE